MVDHLRKLPDPEQIVYVFIRSVIRTTYHMPKPGSYNNSTLIIILCRFLYCIANNTSFGITKDFAVMFTYFKRQCARLLELILCLMITQEEHRLHLFADAMMSLVNFES